jgi:site-specific DNA-cytosine methylase
MRYLSVCSGIEAASVAWHPLGWEPLAFSEIEPFPRAVLAHHYPDVPCHGDFTVLRDLPFIVDADVLVGGTPCFTAGHLVLTEDGYRPIEDIRPGDKVMTHLGRLQRVVRVGSKVAEVGEIRAVGLPMPIKTTPDHPFLSVTWRNQNTKRNNEYAKVEHCGEPEWTAAKDMPGKQWCALTAYMPIEAQPRSTKFTDREAMYAAGMYLGDGHIRQWEGKRKKALVLSLNGAKLAKLAAVIGEDGYTISHERTSVRATIYDTELCEWLLENFGHYSHLKKIPAWVLSHQYRADLLQGYVDTDGCVYDNCISFSTTSAALAFGVADLLNAEGNTASVKFIETPDTCVIEGREVNQRDCYQVRGFPRDASRKSRVRHGYLLRSVQSYVETGEEMVFNIEVEEDNSFILNGAVVHNCQAFSVAGLRNSLADERGNLSLEFVRLADAIDDVRRAANKPEAIIVWENVPGVLSVKDNAFGCFLAALAGEDDPLVPPRGKWTNAGVVDGPKRKIAWRVLDAQYFGLAQRRRRVFVVASSRDGFDPAEVLFELEGVQRHSAPSREAGQAASAGTASRAGERSSHWDGDFPHPTLNQSAKVSGGVGSSNQELFSQRGAYLAPAHPVVMAHGQANAEIRTDGGTPALTCIHEAPIAAYAVMEDPVPPLMARSSRGGAQTLSPGHQTDGHMVAVTHSLRGEGFDASEDGTGRGTPLVPVLSNDPAHAICANEQRTYTNEGSMFQLRNVVGQPVAIGVQASQSGVRLNETAGTLDANYGPRRHNGVLVPKGDAAPCVATFLIDMYNAKRDPEKKDAINRNAVGVGGEGDPSYTLNRVDVHAVAIGMAVRRLTPTECERLQGFPDGYTNIPWRKKPEAPDGPRYKAIGNSMAVPCMRWIGERIQRHLRGET